MTRWSLTVRKPRLSKNCEGNVPAGASCKGTIQEKVDAHFVVLRQELPKINKKSMTVDSKKSKRTLHCHEHCHTVLLVLATLLIGCYNHGVQDQVADTEQSTVLSNEPLSSRSKSPIDEGVFEVVKIIDGDTLVITDRAKEYRVRLIGADTPEVVKSDSAVEAFGLDASEFTKQMIAESSNRIRIAFDGEQIDRYKRTLAMVYVQTPDGEIWLNELLIREGLAQARLDYRYSHGAKLSFAIAEVEARRNKRNLWKDAEE